MPLNKGCPCADDSRDPLDALRWHLGAGKNRIIENHRCYRLFHAGEIRRRLDLTEIAGGKFLLQRRKRSRGRFKRDESDAADGGVRLRHLGRANGEGRHIDATGHEFIDAANQIWDQNGRHVGDRQTSGREHRIHFFLDDLLAALYSSLDRDLRVRGSCQD